MYASRLLMNEQLHLPNQSRPGRAFFSPLQSEPFRGMKTECVFCRYYGRNMCHRRYPLYVKECAVRKTDAGWGVSIVKVD